MKYISMRLICKYSKILKKTRKRAIFDSIFFFFIEIQFGERGVEDGR